MRKESKQILWLGCIVLGLFLAATPFLVSYAQKESESPKVENQNEAVQIVEARAAVAKSVVGSMVLDTISVNESKWELNKAGYVGRGLHNNFTYFDMLLNKGDSFLAVSISEHDSPKDADEQFGGPTTRSYGMSVPFSNYGDKGDKLIGQTGDLMAIRFRKGNFFVAIWNRDQKTAERFAAYVLNSLNDSAIK